MPMFIAEPALDLPVVMQMGPFVRGETSPRFAAAKAATKLS